MLDLSGAPPYHFAQMENVMTETTPFVRPDVALFLQFLNAVPGPKFWEVSADEARTMTSAMREDTRLASGNVGSSTRMLAGAWWMLAPIQFRPHCVLSICEAARTITRLAG